MRFRPVEPGVSDPIIGQIRTKYAILPITDEWDERVIQRVRGMQLLYGLPPDGVVDQKTVAVMGLVAS